jgi:hypothetical protein
MQREDLINISFLSPWSYILGHINFLFRSVMLGMSHKISVMVETNHSHDDINTEDLPQIITESYGTGVKDLPGYNVGERSLWQHPEEYTESSPEFPAEYAIAADDINTYWQETVGDEAVGGTVAMPEQDITEEIAAAVGLEIEDNALLRTNEMLEQRDDSRWELDPMSSEDYAERRE